MERMLAILVAILLAISSHCQGTNQDDIDPFVLRSVEACHSVAMKHLAEVESTINAVIKKYNETCSPMKSYVKKWGDRVVAAAPKSAQGVAVCQAEFAQATRNISQALKKNLRTRVMDHLKQNMTWYDDQIFSLFATDGGHQAVDAVVKEVKAHLERTNFASLVEDSEEKWKYNYNYGRSMPVLRRVPPLKKPIKELMPVFESVSKCIRDIEIQHGEAQANGNGGKAKEAAVGGSNALPSIRQKKILTDIGVSLHPKQVWTIFVTGK